MSLHKENCAHLQSRTVILNCKTNSDGFGPQTFLYQLHLTGVGGNSSKKKTSPLKLAPIVECTSCLYPLIFSFCYYILLQNLHHLMVPLNRVSELVSPSVVIRCLQHMVFAPSISTSQASPLGVVLVNQVCLKSKDIFNIFMQSN